MAQGTVTPSVGGNSLTAPNTTSTGGGGGHHCRPGCGGLSRLMRKLRRQSKMLCMATTSTRPTTFQCQYDPLSYARNFDCSGFGTALDDDSNHVYYSFSSRFVLVGSTDH